MNMYLTAGELREMLEDYDDDAEVYVSVVGTFTGYKVLTVAGEDEDEVVIEVVP